MTIEQTIRIEDIVTDDIPVLTAPQRQGDVYIWPADLYEPTTATGKSRDVHPSFDVVEAGTARHAHTLAALAGHATFTPARSANGLAIGVLTVEDDGVCYLSHVEHATLGIGVGTYVVARQREQATEQRLVAD